MTSPSMTELPAEVEEYRQLMKSDLVLHTRYVHGFWMPEHQRPWAKALQDMSIERLLIIAPPKYGKSPTVGLDYLGWRIGNDPDHYHAIYVSNTANQAYRFSVALRDTVSQNGKYKFLYGLVPDPNKGWSEGEWFIKRTNPEDKDPTLQACGIGGSILGATVEEVVFDDVADPENMATLYQREKLMKWLRTVPLSRLIPGVSRVIMICTRWHEEDPSAEFEKEGWTVLKIPAIDDKGKPTYPSYWTIPELDKRKVDLGPRQFELMFQGNVLPEAGNIFQREWWRYWKQGEAPWQKTGDELSPILSIVQSWDTAFKSKQEHDYQACETWAICKNGYYLLNAWRAKMDFPKLKIAFRQMYDQFKPVYVLIEDAASGQDLIAEMRVESAIPIVAITVVKDKVARANAVTPLFEAEKVWIPIDASWRYAWESEHEVFPTGRNDDWVDCFDEKTELLTKEGWKRFDGLTGSEKVATLSETGKLEYQKPTAYQAYRYSGYMVAINHSKQIDLVVTPNHKMYVSKYRWANVFEPFGFGRAIELGYCRFKRDAIWEGEDREYFSLPGYTNKTNRKQGCPPMRIEMNAWLDFLGWFVAEGWTAGGQYIRRVGIAQSQTVNAEKVDQIRLCLERLPFKYKHNPRRGFTIDNAQLARYLSNNVGDDFHRRIPREFLGLPSYRLRQLYISMMAGDGCKDKQYYTVSPQLADDFLELLLKIGYAGTAALRKQKGKKALHGMGQYDLFIICISKRNLRPRVNDPHHGTAVSEIVGYDGMVYCCTVPNHTLYVRRNGKPCWVGNCTTQFLNWARLHVTTGPTRPTEIRQKSKWRD